MGRKKIEKCLLVGCVLLMISLSLGLCGTIEVITGVSVSWDDARSICQSQGMDLVIIEDSAEMARVDQCVADNGGYIRDCWIGGRWDYEAGSLKWVDNSPFSLSHPELDFGVGEPNCLPGFGCGSTEDCIRVTVGGKLRTMTCSRSYDVICEAPNGFQNCISPLATTTTDSPIVPTSSNKKKGLSIGAIIGLVAGFATFIFIVVMCCCIWKTFCGISDDDKIAPDPDGIHTLDLSEEACQRIATDNPWLQHEEVSFCLRNKYTFEDKETTMGPRFTYIK